MHSVKKHGILKGYRVYIPPNIKPSHEELKALIESCDGTVIKARPNEDRDDTLVIINEDDDKTARTFAVQNIPTYSTEIIYSGILNQKLDFSVNKMSQ